MAFVTETLAGPASYWVLHRSFIGARTEQDALKLYTKLGRNRLIPVSNILGEGAREPRLVRRLIRTYVSGAFSRLPFFLRLAAEAKEASDVGRRVREYCQHAQNLAALRDGGFIRRAAIAVKPTQLFGLHSDEHIFRRALADIAAVCSHCGVECTLDAEYAHTHQRVYAVLLSLYADFPCLGACFQANVRENQEWFETCISRGIRVRIVKGGYHGSIRNLRDINQRFFSMVRAVSFSDGIVEIGTHDTELLYHALRLCKARRMSPDRVRIQMLYGVRMKAQSVLAEAGDSRCLVPREYQYDVRDLFTEYCEGNVMVYVPWGGYRAGFHYLKRRFKEGMRPGLAMLFLRNIWESYRWRKTHLRDNCLPPPA